MKFRKLIISFIILLAMLFIGSAQAAELTLDDCIKLALQNRSSIIMAQGSKQLAGADKRSALGAFLPRLSASYDYGKSKQTDIKSGPVGGPQLSLPDQDGTNKGLTISSSMYFSFSNIYNYTSAKTNYKAADLDVIDSKQDLIFSVKLSYYAYLANVENVQVQQEAVKRSEEQLKLINSRFELGSASKSDVLKQKVQFGNDKLALLRANNAVVTSRANLAYTIGLDSNKDYEFSSTYVSSQFDGTLDEAVSFGLINEPGLQSIINKVDSRKSSVKSAKSRYLPTASAYASYSVSDGTSGIASGNAALSKYSSTSKRYGFGFSWSIFDGFARERNVTAAKVNLNNYKAYEAETRNLVVRDIKTAFYEIEQQKQAKDVADENVNAAEEDLKITQEKYNLGAATILDLLDAQVSFKRAQMSLIQADFDLNLAEAQLNKAMGKN